MPPSVEESLWIRVQRTLRKMPLLFGLLRWLRRKAYPRFLKLLVDLIRPLFPRSSIHGPARGLFAEYDSFRKKPDPGEGRVILEDQGAPGRLPEPSMILLSGRRQHAYQPWPVLWKKYERARLIGPSLAHVDRQKRLCSEAVYGSQCYRDDPSYNHVVTGPPTSLEGRWTSLVSRWSSVDRPQPYGHWILDALPRLAVLDEFPSDTGILVPPFRTRYQEESLQLLGLLDRCRWTSEQHLLLDEYYFSSPVSMIVAYSPYAVAFLRKAFLPLAERAATKPKRVFVTRNTRIRNILNREEVDAFFAEAGWTICDTAEMSFIEQVRLFADAETLCLVHGSAIQNSVWCPEGCKIIELFAANYPAGDGEWIAACTGAEYSFMVFPCDADMNIAVDLPKLKAHLKAAKVL